VIAVNIGCHMNSIWNDFWSGGVFDPAQHDGPDHLDIDCEHLGLRSIVQKAQFGRGRLSWKLC